MALTHGGEGALLLVLPDVVRLGKVPTIVDFLLDRDFDIIRQKDLWFTYEDAVDFLQDISFPNGQMDLVSQLCSGQTHLLILQHPCGGSVAKLNDIVGPCVVEDTAQCQDPRQETLRGLFAATDCLSGFYCSPCDWGFQRDMEFFFPCLDKSAVTRTVALVKPDAIDEGVVRQIEDAILDSGLVIIQKKSFRLSLQIFDAFYGHLSDQAVAMLLEGKGAVRRWRLLCGPTDSRKARLIGKRTIRAKYGTHNIRNAVHCSDSASNAEKEMFLLFSKSELTMERTFAIIKPDGMQPSIKEQVLADIRNKRFHIIRQKELSLYTTGAKQIFAAHEGKDYFENLISYMTSGPVTALVLMRVGAVEVWKDAVGKRFDRGMSPRKQSLRGKYAKDKLYNVVHAASSAEQAEKSICTFFPELPLYASPDVDFVRDYFFCKRAMRGNSIENYTVEKQGIAPTLQLLISRGLRELCATRPTGVNAVRWLADWLEKNARAHTEDVTQPAEPPARATKNIICVDKDHQPPPVVFREPATKLFYIRVIGAPSSGRSSLCRKIAEETGHKALLLDDTVAEEVSAGSAIGQLITEQKKDGIPLPLQAKLWKKVFSSNKDVQRFVLHDNICCVEQAKYLDRELGPPAITIFLKGSRQPLPVKSAEGEVTGEDVENSDSVCDNTEILRKYYESWGKVFEVEALQPLPTMYKQVRALVCPTVTFIFADVQLDALAIAGAVQDKQDFFHIDACALLKQDARLKSTASAFLSSGAPPPASVVCPLVVHKIQQLQAKGHDAFVLTNFPKSMKQLKFFEEKAPCSITAVRLDASPATLKVLTKNVSSSGSTSIIARETQRKNYKSQEMGSLFQHLEERGCLRAIDCNFLQTCPLAESAICATERLATLVLRALRPKVVLLVGPCASDLNKVGTALRTLKPNCGIVDCHAAACCEVESNTTLGKEIKARGGVKPVVHLLQKAVHHSRSATLIVSHLPSSWSNSDIGTFSEEVDVKWVINVKSSQPTSDPSAEDEDSQLDASLTKRLTNYFAKKGKVVTLREALCSQPIEDIASELLRSTAPVITAVVGPPTVGLEVVADTLRETYGYKVLPDMNGLMRAAKASHKLTKQEDAAVKIDEELPVDPDIVAAVVAAAVESDFTLQGSSCVLTGYPQTAQQAAAFEKRGLKIGKLIRVCTPNEADYQRLQNDDEEETADFEDLELDMQSYALKIEDLANHFRKQGKLIDLNITTDDVGEVTQKLLRPEVLLFPTAHLSASLVEELSSFLSKKHDCVAIDVGTLCSTEETEKALPAEEVYHDKIALSSRDTVASRLLNVNVVEVLSTAMKQYPAKRILLTGFPFAPLEPQTSGVYQQLLQLKQVCRIEGLILLDVPACEFDNFACSRSLLHQLDLSIIEYAYSVNDLLLSALSGSVKSRVRLALQSGKSVKDIKRAIEEQLLPSSSADNEQDQ